MKRISNTQKALILLAPALAPMLYYIFFLSAQFFLRQEMKHDLHSKELSAIVISDPEALQSREILIEGRLFDIERIEKLPDGKLLAIGLFDDLETELADCLTENENDTDSDGSLLSGLANWVLFPPQETANRIDHSAENVYANFILNKMTSPVLDLLKPPPRTC